jgi:hypothetical protein
VGFPTGKMSDRPKSSIYFIFENQQVKTYILRLRRERQRIKSDGAKTPTAKNAKGIIFKLFAFSQDKAFFVFT